MQKSRWEGRRDGRQTSKQSPALFHSGRAPSSYGFNLDASQSIFSAKYSMQKINPATLTCTFGTTVPQERRAMQGRIAVHNLSMQYGSVWHVYTQPRANTAGPVCGGRDYRALRDIYYSNKTSSAVFVGNRILQAPVGCCDSLIWHRLPSVPLHL
jgi:hypothetical protein